MCPWGVDSDHGGSVRAGGSSGPQSQKLLGGGVAAPEPAAIGALGVVAAELELEVE